MPDLGLRLPLSGSIQLILTSLLLNLKVNRYDLPPDARPKECYHKLPLNNALLLDNLLIKCLQDLRHEKLVYMPCIYYTFKLISSSFTTDIQHFNTTN